MKSSVSKRERLSFESEKKNYFSHLKKSPLEKKK
jgi:hypothetical protein